MSKLVVLLALYAAAVSTYLLLEVKKEGSGASRTSAAASDGHPDLRKLMGEARALMRAEVKETLRNIDWRLGRMDELSKSMQAGLMAAQSTAEDAADANYGKLETLEEVVQGFGRATSELVKIRVEFSKLRERMQALEERPPQVIREIVKGGPAAPRPAPKSDRKKLPVARGKDPKVVAAEVAKARQGIQSDDLEILFPAIEKVREHRVMDAVPRLIEILASHKDEFGRAASAAALGKMRVADAVPALAEALVDKSELVAQQANKSLREITEFDTELSATAGIRKRRTARNKMKEWWRGHESEVRARLGQPKPGG